jgi:hypothetical protein
VQHYTARNSFLGSTVILALLATCHLPEIGAALILRRFYGERICTQWDLISIMISPAEWSDACRSQHFGGFLFTYTSAKFDLNMVIIFRLVMLLLYLLGIVRGGKISCVRRRSVVGSGES